MASVWNISNMEHFSLGLFGHFKYFIVFKCPNSNTIRFNSKIQNGLEICASFLAEVSTLTRNHELFLGTFWDLLKNILFDPI